ncbi:MAG: ATP-binding protein [Gaiellaceae bacterium]
MIRRRKPGAVRHSRLGERTWVAAAVLAVVLGAVGSVFAARVVARSDEQKSQQAFAATSTDIASKLRLAVEHENDLVLSASAFIVANPNISTATFKQWMRVDRAFERYPEIISFGRLVVVQASQLPAFAARAIKDPAGRLAPDGSFQVVPPGNRPFYCFLAPGGQPPGHTPELAGHDFCSGGNGQRLIASRDSGRGTYEPIPLGKVTGLGVQVPLYRGGGVPTTVAARRAAYIGSIGSLTLPKIVLDTALEGHPGTAVTLRFAQGPTPAAFSGGKAPRGAQSFITNLHNGWTVHTSAAVSGSGVFSNGDSLALLIGGIALSVLLGLLGAVLATGRTRALRLVNEQTITLRDQTAELRGTVAELEAAQAIKDEFLALVSHELRTPLTSICGYTEMLQDETLTDQQHDYVEVVDRNAARLLGLVEDILLMTRIQNGGLPLELGEVVLNDLIARSGDTARPFAASKEIDLDIDTEPNIATQGDPTRLGQVLDNLVSNAIKYTPNGGDVSITMTRTGETATIAVTDTGIGIPRDEHDRMFDRFFRTSNARDSGIAGTGLGLAITREIVEAHGGTIGFESVEGAGTTFRITLPHAYGAGLEAAA